MTLGSTNVLTPDQARAAARETLAIVQLGDDPGAARADARDMPSFREFAERYLTEEAEPKLKPKTVVNYRIYLRKHAAPHIGSIKLDRVAPKTLPKCTGKSGKKRLLPQTG